MKITKNEAIEHIGSLGDIAYEFPLSGVEREAINAVIKFLQDAVDAEPVATLTIYEDGTSDLDWHTLLDDGQHGWVVPLLTSQLESEQ